jgi:sterol carrier protein 2
MKVYVVGVGMTNFEKPGRRPDFDYPQMALEATSDALKDAGLHYRDVGQAYVGYAFGESTCGQRALYQLGMTGIPIVNVNNNCATGSSALFLAHEMIAGGRTHCALALGFEKMERGSLGPKWDDRTNPLDKHLEAMSQQWGFEAAPPACQLFGNAGKEHMKKYGSRPEHFGQIAMKNHLHSVNNPRSQFKDKYTLQQIMDSKTIHDPLTKLQCCPTSDGGAAVILVSEQLVISRGLQDRAVLVAGISLTSDLPSCLAGDAIQLVGSDMTRKAATEVYRQSRITPDQVDVVELHDCFSANELITYEALGLCPQGQAHLLVERGDNTYGGKYVINPSGGLISKGHPLGATGIAQCVELCLQLRNLADLRQVKGAKIALQHNLGLGGACVVAAYRLGFPDFSGTLMTTPPLKGGLSAGSFKCSAVFSEIEKQLSAEGDALVKKVKAIYKFKVSADDGKANAIWLVDAKNGSGCVTFMDDGKADCTLSAKDSDLFDMMTGKSDAMKAYMSGKLKLSGNIMLAQKLKDFKGQAAAVAGTLPSSGNTPAPLFESDAKFEEMTQALKADPGLSKKVASAIKFVITRKSSKDKKIWFVDCRRSPGEVTAGRDDKADCTIEVPDDVWVSITSGKLNPQKAFFEKKLKISGNMMIATKLAIFQPKPQAKL